MRVLRFLGLLLYIGYLVQVGLVMLLLPWNPLWGYLVAQLPPGLAAILDLPAVRGAISGFGLVHLLLVATELVLAPASRPSGEAR